MLEVDKQFQKTLSYHTVLKKQPINDYDFLLKKGCTRQLSSDPL